MVRVVGAAHGGLWLLYLAALLYTALKLRWKPAVSRRRLLRLDLAARTLDLRRLANEAGGASLATELTRPIQSVSMPCAISRSESWPHVALDVAKVQKLMGELAQPWVVRKAVLGGVEVEGVHDRVHSRADEGNVAKHRRAIVGLGLVGKLVGLDRRRSDSAAPPRRRGVRATARTPPRPGPGRAGRRRRRGTRRSRTCAEALPAVQRSSGHRSTQLREHRERRVELFFEGLAENAFVQSGASLASFSRSASLVRVNPFRSILSCGRPAAFFAAIRSSSERNQQVSPRISTAWRRS